MSKDLKKGVLIKNFIVLSFACTFAVLSSILDFRSTSLVKVIPHCNFNGEFCFL